FSRGSLVCRTCRFVRRSRRSKKTGHFDAKEKKQLEELKDNVLAYDNSMTIVQDAATRNETEEAYTAYTQGLEQVRDNVADSAKSLMASMTKQAKSVRTLRIKLKNKRPFT
ncbi:MCP four helix bundle domain-containing protein, partial [Cronobacter sakazakii]|uniref:MCP four helix bundle domain-containing protein n=1 Tax=Cronobacter sakazakii TaxID=28141 RepID=UPI0018F87FFD